MFRNKIINGGFDIWQRGISQTSNGYGSDDRWNNGSSGSTKTASQQVFTNGQTDVPGNPRFWSRTVVSSVPNVANYVLKVQPIENVSTLSGQTATVSFWAKADATKNIAVEFVQNFGTGGSPSFTINGIGITTVALTTSWQRFTATVSLPSISGKTRGTNNDHSLQLVFWFDAGSNYNARTNSLGQQSGTFDIANVQLEAGPVATPFEQRPIGLELSLCQRYYETSRTAATVLTSIHGTAYGSNIMTVWYKVQKRANGNVYLYDYNNTSTVSNRIEYNAISTSSGVFIAATANGGLLGFAASVSNTGLNGYANFHYATEAEL